MGPPETLKPVEQVDNRQVLIQRLKNAKRPGTVPYKAS
jgi:hypothetical protein